ncbi:MAG: hypothetical protein J6N49_00485, partial [Alphaproteobacteria bacterium]|nr:hypothetical protein [Alphaproteobacteria bacterium]
DCGNCTGTCVNKGCPTGYRPENPGGCPDTAPSGDGTFTCYGNYKKCTCPDGKVESCGSDKKSTGSEVIGDTTCYTCVDKTCTDYGYQDTASCPTGQKAVTKTPRTGLTCYTCVNKKCSDYNLQDTGSCGSGYNPQKVTLEGLTCYRCVAKKCGDYGYQSSSSCGTGYTAQSRYPTGNLHCYECISDDSYTDSSSDAISDGISNGGEDGGCYCGSVDCGSIGCYVASDNDPSLGSGGKKYWCEFNGSYQCASQCCSCGSPERVTERGSLTCPSRASAK